MPIPKYNEQKRIDRSTWQAIELPAAIGYRPLQFQVLLLYARRRS
jgi:hypothetical protein